MLYMEYVKTQVHHKDLFEKWGHFLPPLLKLLKRLRDDITESKLETGRETISSMVHVDACASCEAINLMNSFNQPTKKGLNYVTDSKTLLTSH